MSEWLRIRVSRWARVVGIREMAKWVLTSNFDFRTGYIHGVYMWCISSWMDTALHVIQHGRSIQNSFYNFGNIVWIKATSPKLWLESQKLASWLTWPGSIHFWSQKVGICFLTRVRLASKRVQVRSLSYEN